LASAPSGKNQDKQQHIDKQKYIRRRQTGPLTRVVEDLLDELATIRKKISNKTWRASVWTSLWQLSKVQGKSVATMQAGLQEWMSTGEEYHVRPSQPEILDEKPIQLPENPRNAFYF